LQNAPKWTGAAGATYEVPVGTGTMTANVQYRFNSAKYYTNVLNTKRSQIQPIHFVDANLDWTPENEKWTVGLWARNLFDKRYVSVAFDSPGALALVGYHPPREWGASFKYHL
jgi:iron complex outermembrane receptor protein